MLNSPYAAVYAAPSPWGAAASPWPQPSWGVTPWGPTPWGPPSPYLAPMPALQSLDVFSPGRMGDRQRAEALKEQGNVFRRQRLPQQAIRAYEQSIQADPTYTDSYFNLGQTYLSQGERARAIDAFSRLLEIDPADHDARVAMANQLMQVGRLADAKTQYEKTLALAPTFDPASRQLAYARLLQSAQSQPDPPAFIAETLQQEGARRVALARDLLKTHFLRQGDASMVETLARVRTEFAVTQQVNQSHNIAEYDHFAGRLIRFSPEMAFSRPNALAAYFAHELVHARDDDAITSVREEQDGYRALAQVWRQYKATTLDPNLDLALKYLDESKLDEKVRNLYLLREPGLRETSPGHGLPASWNASAHAAEPAASVSFRPAPRLSVSG